MFLTGVRVSCRFASRLELKLGISILVKLEYSWILLVGLSSAVS